MLTGILQLLMGVFKLGKWMRYVPHSVITGFINALAILILLSQLRYFQGQTWGMYAMVACTLAVIYLLPELTKAIPSPLVAVALMTIAAATLPYHGQTVGDLAQIVPTLPAFGLPDIPMTLGTLWLILLTSISLAIVATVRAFRSDKSRSVQSEA
ncbi:SulP family inorganic anion transporter [Cohnella sp. REN36]|uniref:SulP family inorganic anion transporter n=1 Tax=Cohnella sp. REN36 TaxID=2887347 RepID=UPI00351D41C5